MASNNNPPPVKRPGKAKNKRLVQPVVPVLPQISAARKNNGGAVYQADHVANGFVQEAAKEESRRTSTTASLSLPNGEHNDGIQELPGDDAAAEEIGASSAARSPVSQSVPAKPFPPFEPQSVPSVLLDQTEASSASPSGPETSQIREHRPSTPPASNNSFNFASDLSQIRSTRAQDHKIMFHAPLESPSPSHATQRSLSVPSISTPPPDLSPLHLISMPERGTSAGQEEQVSIMIQRELPVHKVAELPEQSRPDSPLDFQPESTHEPLPRTPTLPPTEGRDLCDTVNIFQPGGRADTVDSNDESDGRLGNTSITGSQPEAPNGSIQINGHAHKNSVHSGSSDSDLDEHTLEPLSEHLARLFTSKQWVDWSIQVISPDPGLHAMGYAAHGVLMARSPALRRGMNDHLHSNRVERVIIVSPDRYIQPPAFEAALRYLYTESLLTKVELEEMSGGNGDRGPKFTREYQADISLSYWMAGLILGLQEVAQQAVKLVRDIVDWDVLEYIYLQALNLDERTRKLTNEVSNANGFTPGSSPASKAFVPSSQNTLHNPFGPSSDYFGPYENQDATPHYHNSAINATMSKKIKRVIFDFLSIHLDTSKFEMEDPPTTILKSYLPDTREYSTRSRYRANPALAAIRFGSMPLADEVAPANAPSEARTPEHVTSAVVLNMSYADLSELCLLLTERTSTMQLAGETLKTHGSSTHTQNVGSTPDRIVDRLDNNLPAWIQKVTDEREKRRRKVLKSRTVSNQERRARKQLWDVVGWEEYAVGTEIHRSFKDFTLPGPMVVNS